MSVGGFLLKVLTSYGASVFVVTLVVLWWGSFPGGIQSLDWAGVMLCLKLSAVFSLPFFVLVGLPYMSFGYRSWGRESVLAFMAGGFALGSLGSLAFGMLLTMPQTVPAFFPIGGFLAGAISSVVWTALANRWGAHAND